MAVRRLVAQSAKSPCAGRQHLPSTYSAAVLGAWWVSEQYQHCTQGGHPPKGAAVAAADWVAQPAEQPLSASAALDKATALASSIDYEQLGNTALGASRAAADAAGRLAGEAVAPFDVFGAWPLNLLFLGVLAAMAYSIAIAPRQ